MVKFSLFKKFYSELTTDLVEKLLSAPNNFFSSDTKKNYADIFNNKKLEFQLLTYPAENVVKKVCLA